MMNIMRSLLSSSSLSWSMGTETLFQLAEVALSPWGELRPARRSLCSEELGIVQFDAQIFQGHEGPS